MRRSGRDEALDFLIRPNLIDPRAVVEATAALARVGLNVAPLFAPGQHLGQLEPLGIRIGGRMFGDLLSPVLKDFECLGIAEHGCRKLAELRLDLAKMNE